MVVREKEIFEIGKVRQNGVRSRGQLAIFKSQTIGLKQLTRAKAATRHVFIEGEHEIAA
jgi:hypothetical protein